MAHGAPDWTRQVQVVIVEAQPGEEQAAGDTGRYSGVDQAYQQVAIWTVATGKIGELKHITLVSDDYDKTEWKILVGDVTYATGWAIQQAIVLVFEDLRLEAAKEIEVQAQSTDGTPIKVDATIVGKEIG